MGNLYFPQLGTGASGQYPIRKTRVARTVKNVLPDGSMLVFADTGSGRLYWQISYVDLSLAEANALQAHFQSCAGPVHAFTFIDPTDNMLVASSDFTASVWSVSTSITLTPGATDPAGGTGAFVATNNSGVAQQISQTLAVPANYQYCFSVYTSSVQSALLTLGRRGASAEQLTTCELGPGWSRIIATGTLNDAGTELTVAISLTGGQSLSLYGPQLEAQQAPSRYRATFQQGGVYPLAHWAVDELIVNAEAPNLFSTSFTIESSL